MLTKFKIFTVLLLFMLLATNTVAGQSKQDKARAIELGQEAIALMDGGNIKKSLELLEEAQKLDPKNFNYPYEMAYAHYLDSDFKSSIKILKKLVKHPDVQPNAYQMLGNAYSLSGQRDKAIKTYKKGLDIFPNAGPLYLELGNVERAVESYNEALTYYEKGIEVDPAFPSNYYWTSILFANSTEEVWGMIYGEIFIHLEPNTKRTSEISKLLFDVYKSEIQFQNDTSFSISFSQNNVITIDDISNLKIPFGLGIYETTLSLAVIGESQINLESLNRIRSRFIELYFEKEHHKKYPNILFDLHKKILDAGHFEAYNYWILMVGAPEEFEKWAEQNKDKWQNFGKWFVSNLLQIDEENKFHRSQY
ncbi:MAG: tetratricopeptide repeat protein [Bernardetiaceae bacterium]|nr:tetratricopeptide repeat protein [Bernardetiaceae bacterium]